MTPQGFPSDSPNPLPNTPMGPLSVSEDCWMVGHRNPQALLQCNTYVRQFGHGGPKTNVCIDPGSQFDVPVIESNIAQLIGGLDQIHCMTVNHQDPDVAGNLPYFSESSPNSELIVTEETWRLLQHTLIKPGSLRLATMANTFASIAGAHRLQLVPTPFCHFRGAMAFYDPEIRTLFTGDLFGGLNRVGAVHLEAIEEDWAGIAQFHQIYMPSREILRFAVRQILNLKPRVEIIAPQHGHVIKGDLVGQFLDQMHELPVGNDLLSGAWDKENLNGYREVIQRLIELAESEIGHVEVSCRLTATDVEDELQSHYSYVDGDIRMKKEGFMALAKTFHRLAQSQGSEAVVAMQRLIIESCAALGLPAPPINLGLREGEF